MQNTRQSGTRLHAADGQNAIGQNAAGLSGFAPADASFGVISPETLGLAAGITAIGTGGGIALRQPASASSPTVAQFLNAANAEYIIGGVPAGMHPFTFLGVPVSYTDILDGVSAQVWVTQQNQIVIAYQGTTGGENIAIDPVAALTQIITDIGIYAGTTPPAEIDSLNFANFVLGLAKLEGYSSSNVFVTGHSLGGIEAEYVASKTGLGGIGFETTGLLHFNGEGAGGNFVNIATYGDPVGNYSSDIKGEQPFSAKYVAGGGSLPHYGDIVTVGNASDKTTLTQDVAKWGDGNPIDQAAVLANLVGLLLDFHLPGTQAHDLGVSLNPYSSIVDGLGVQNSAVFNVANDTISQLIAAASAHGNLLPG
jgi:hypothetical protein